MHEITFFLENELKIKEELTMRIIIIIISNWYASGRVCGEFPWQGSIWSHCKITVIRIR